MGLFDLFRTRNKNTASIAKERLRIIVAQERTSRGTPDYLPMLRRELLETIRKYVNVDFDAVKVDLIKEDGHDVLDISVSLPDRNELAVAPLPATG
jgi:cell division topological specificity factor